MAALLLALATIVAVENQKPGAFDWELTSPALNREIEGFASKTSVNGGEPIDLFVSTASPRYTIDVFRMGWYRGAGALRYAGPIARRGFEQEMPAANPATGLVECRWTDPYRLETRDDNGPWPSGVYLARLTAAPAPNPPGLAGGASETRSSRRRGASPDRTSLPMQSFIVFVVRDDDRASAIVFQSSVTTFAAYNNWGGRSLYAFNSGNAPARKVSFDRPYAANPYGVRLDGAGDFLRRWEYNAVRFLEREGYDVSYVTDVDTDQRPVADDASLRHRIFLSIGHDEYWSWAMRDHVEQARERGVHLAFLGADAGYWQIRFEPSARGEPDRTIVAYKETAAELDPLATDRDPRNNRLVTGRWRDRPTSRPEERLVGVMYAADPVDSDIVVADARHWVFGGTGLKNGDALRGLLGYEADAVYGYGPRDVVRLGHSPIRDRSGTRYADMTIYAAASGALVFATGSMQWNWGLDGYNAPAWHPLRVSPQAQRITRNVLNRMLETRTAPASRAASSNPIVLIALVLAAAFVARAWLKRPRRV